MIKYIFLIGLFIFSCAESFSQTAAPPKDDVQFWSETSVSFPLLKKTDEKGKQSEKIGFFLNGTLRFGGNVSRLADKRIGFGFDFFVHKNITLSTSYFYRAAEPYRNRKEFEHRVRFDVSLGKSWSRFSIRDRNRIEYRIRNSTADSVRYRNKFQLNVPVTKRQKTILTPFVATEPFYDFRQRAWTRNEFSAGVSRKINDNLTADFFYLLQNNRGNVLRTINVFGVNLKVKVD